MNDKSITNKFNSIKTYVETMFVLGIILYRLSFEEECFLVQFIFY